jgi:hypothetical protein
VLRGRHGLLVRFSFLFRRAIILLEENPLGCSVEIFILSVLQ